MRLFFTPTDVLFFRGPLPFTAGEESAAQSLFPPTPETVQGMLRALIASQWAPTLAEAFSLPEVRELVGGRDSNGQDSPGRFRLTALTLGRRRDGGVERLFPAPAHLLRQESGDRTSVLLRPDTVKLAPQGTGTNLPDGLRVLVPPDGTVAAGTILETFDRWLDEDELTACLRPAPAGAAGLTDKAGITSGEIFTFEPRIGIGLRPGGKTVEEGRFYQQRVVRIAPDHGLVVDIELAPADATRPAGASLSPDRVVAAGELLEVLHLPPAGWSHLGGERRTVRYEVLPNPPAAEPAATYSPDRRTVLYFATPTYFRRGWRPEDWATIFGISPVAAAVPRSQLIGGLGLEPGSARGTPKPLRRCVPAGSVYFFDRPPTRPGPYTEYGDAIGYGHAIEGVW